MKTNMLKSLAEFIQSLIDDAENDNPFDVAWFKGTKDEKFSIVGGWLESGFNPEDRDLFCISKAHPKYVMAVKIVINDGPYAYCDFETLSMPMDIDNPDEVDNTCTILEWDMNTEALAQFLLGEWERITNDYMEV